MNFPPRLLSRWSTLAVCYSVPAQFIKTSNSSDHLTDLALCNLVHFPKMKIT